MIAVGRLGDPATAEAAVATGKTDFIALGRTLVADPQWVEKVARGEPIRRCLACNTCINEMRGGARIGCVVNGAAGRETLFADAQPPRGERIAVIGAGPAGLTYAALVADGNAVTVFEKKARPGGSFRYAGKAPLYQEVEASEKSFERYIADLAAACEMKGVMFRLATDVNALPGLLSPFDRIVVATGAEYRFGLGARRRLAARPRMSRAPGPGAAVVMAGVARVVLLSRAARHRREFPAFGAARAKTSSSSATRSRRQKQAGDRERFEAALLHS